MILSDRELRATLDRKWWRITPDPREDPHVWSSTAIDLRLDGVLAYWNHPHIGGVPSPVDPSSDGYNYADFVEQWGTTVPIPPEGYSLKPGSFHLGWTIEKIQLPYQSRIAARVEGKSNFARLGLGVLPPFLSPFRPPTLK